MTVHTKAAITVGPYLQTPTPNSIYICWQTDEETESRILFGLTAAPGNEVNGDYYSFSSNTIWHWVKLTGLVANTKYFYKCITGTSETAVYCFKTQPPDGETNTHVRFAIYGDNQDNNSNRHDTLVTRMIMKMEQLFGKPLEEKVNVIISTGDIVGKGNGSFFTSFKTEWFDPIRSVSCKIPFMITTGGHEGNPKDPSGNGVYTNLYNYVKYEDIGGRDGEYYYSFRSSRVLFIVLNFPFTYDDNNQLIPNQPEWLKSVLDTAESDKSLDWVFIFYHSAYISELWPAVVPSDFYKDYLMPYAKSHCKVAMIASGHTHGYERNQVPDYPIYRIITGGGAGDLDNWGMYADQSDLNQVQKAYAHYNYVLIDVDCADKSFKAWVYSQGTPENPKNNFLLDSFGMKRANTSTPDKPTAISTTGLLKASAYAGKEPLQSSQFQVTSIRGNYTTPMIDTIRDYEDIYNDENKNAGIDLSKLAVSLKGNYWWRMRYRDRNLAWSVWSEEQNISMTYGTAGKE
jgi:acid phosphatase type 7